MSRFLNVVRLIFVLIALAACAAPSGTSPQFVPNQLPQATGRQESACDAGRADNCALSSPLMNRALEVQEEKSPEAQASHLVTLLDIGAQALQARVHLIRSAQKSIEIQTFIWGEDQTGALLFDELLKAARRGVKVRIIADQMYSRPHIDYLARAAVAHQNLKIKLYNPVHDKAATSRSDFMKGVVFSFLKLNHRMHNKIMVFDGLAGIAGGRNIEDKYFDRDPNFNFIDRDLLVIGPVAKSMRDSFDEFWSDPISRDLDQLQDIRSIIFDGENQRDLPKVPQPDTEMFERLYKQVDDYQHIEKVFLNNAYPVDQVTFTSDRPQKPFIKDIPADQMMRGEFEKIIGNASQSLLLQTPYFILSNKAYRTLRGLRKQNPAMEFTISTNSLASADHYYVYALAFKRKKRNVQKLDFNIFEFKKSPADAALFMPTLKENPDSVVSIHAKSMVVDREYAVVGSHNFDPRSATLNTESVLVVKDSTFARALEKSIKLATKPENSWIIARRQKVPVLGYFSGLFASVSRALPLFDLWPFRYTSSYELREGKEPVPRGHPEFYSNYRNVGQFPGTGLGDNQVKSLLVGGFGAAMEPLM